MKKLNVYVIIIAFGAILLSSGCTPFTKGKPIPSDLADKYAFLILDIQNDFMSKEGKLPVDPKQSNEIIKIINTLVVYFEQKNIDVVYIVNEFDKSDTIANWFRNNAAIKDTKGAELVSDLKLSTNNRFSKSHPDAFSNVDFDNYLRKKNITKLVIAGVFADQCVLSTVKGGVNRKFDVIVIADAIGAKNDRKREKAIESFKKLGVGVVTSDEIVQEIGR